MTEKLHVFGTECMGYHDTESLSNSVGETENQKHQAARRTNGGQCILPKILAYDHGVYHVVELLEQISKQNRKGKKKNDLHWISDRHVFSHSKISFTSYSFAIVVKERD